jgi:putative endopeptidase
MDVKSLRLTLLSLSLVAAFAGAADTPKPASGIDLSGIDASVRPQDDFFKYLNGGWLKATEIPADKSRWGVLDMQAENVKPQLRAIIEAAQKDKHAKAGSDTQKIGDMYASFMDEAKLQKLGARPLAPELKKIHALHDKAQIPATFAHLATLGVTTPYSVSVQQDARESTRYAAYISQSGLGLPDRDYYLKKDDAKMADALAKYEQLIAKMLGMAGEKDPAAAAKAVVALETALAQVQWNRVENRDPVKRYNKVEVAKLDTIMPGYDWKAALDSVGVGGKVDTVIVSQPSYLTGLGEVMAKTDLATWRSYFAWHLISAYAPYLSQDYVDARFDFYGKVLSGTTENEARWKRGVGVIDRSLGEILGRQYVAQQFPAERKARMEELVKNLVAAYGQSIDTLDWMSDATKVEARAKLAKFGVKVGYPNKWRDYSKLTVQRGDLVGNVMRANAFARARNLEKLGQPIDREEWSMTPQTVNAYYSSNKNEIVFPAAILQPPIFDMRADDAVNYGAIGAVIGHEIGHGFDDSGSKSDGDGNLRNWWTDEDRARFQAKADMLGKQYGAFSPVPGYFVDGKLTMGENIGDNSGLAIAFKAYKLSLGGKPSPVIDGLTGEQRFYMGWAQAWRGKTREAATIQRIKSDSHSPGEFRANGTLMNQPGFYEAFGVKEGDKMYRAPSERVIIW